MPHEPTTNQGIESIIPPPMRLATGGQDEAGRHSGVGGEWLTAPFMQLPTINSYIMFFLSGLLSKCYHDSERVSFCGWDDNYDMNDNRFLKYYGT